MAAGEADCGVMQLDPGFYWVKLAGDPWTIGELWARQDGTRMWSIINDDGSYQFDTAEKVGPQIVRPPEAI